MSSYPMGKAHQMKVVHLSNFDDGDGASIAAYRLHRGLLRLGHDSTMLVAEKRTADPTVQLFQPPRDLFSRLRRRWRRERITRSLARYRNSRSAGYELFSDDRTPHGGDLLAQLPAADVINVHVIRLFADYQAFFAAVPRHTPVVRTLHDMNFFTGGCHTDEGCGKYTERCGACPQLGSHKAKDLSQRIWQRKRAVLSSIGPDRLHVVAPSCWLANEAKRSSLLQKFPITVIPFGLDTEDFAPRDQVLARGMLGVPHDARVVLFVAEPITRRIKGFALLAQALNGLGDLSNLLLLSVGSGQPPVKVQVPHLHLGHIRNSRLRSLVYSVADVFVIPSLQENFPLTALEALACGTPIAGFAVGGIPEIVRTGSTGLLAPVWDVAALRVIIRNLLQDPARRAQMAADCRRIAVEEYALEEQVQRYLELYQAALSG
jgi:glycosyltransferase involved in cell wall biosynthesis